MRTLIIPTVILLASCGDPVSFPDIQYSAQGACATPYYQEVLGTYTGTLTRNSVPYSVDLQISGQDYVGLCDMSFNMESNDEWLNGETFTTWVDADGNQSFWNDPTFPVDGLAQANSLTTKESVIGFAGSNVFRVTFQGAGVLTLANTSGALRK